MASHRGRRTAGRWIRDDAVYFMMNRFQALRPYTPPSACSTSSGASSRRPTRTAASFSYLHPHMIGYRSRIWILEELIRHAKAKGDVWFATHADVVRCPRKRRLRSHPWQKQPSSPAARAASAAAVRWRRKGLESRWSMCSKWRGPQLRADRGARRRTLTFRPMSAIFPARPRWSKRSTRNGGSSTCWSTMRAQRTRKGITEITEAEFDRTIAVNLKSCFNFIHAAVPIMLKQDTGGRIISMSSINALSGGVTSAVRKYPMAPPRRASWASPGRWRRNSGRRWRSTRSARG